MQKSPYNKVITPLGLITVFISFTEVIFGISIINTTGITRILSIIFSFFFSSGVAAIFFFILWHKPVNLFGPRDYSDEQIFLKVIGTKEAILNDKTRLLEKLSENIKENIEDEKIKDTIEKISEKYIDEIKNSMLNISYSEYSGNSNDDLEIQYNASSDFDDLTNIVYYGRTYFKPYTYGFDWVLREKESKKIFKHARMITKANPGEYVRDTRSLDDMGILPGMTLEVIKIENPFSPI